MKTDNLTTIFEDYFNLCLEEFVAKKNIQYLISDTKFNLYFSSQSTFERVSPAIKHLISENVLNNVDYEVYVLDKAADFSKIDQLITNSSHPAQIDSNVINYFNNTRYSIAYQKSNGLAEIQLLDKELKKAICCFGKQNAESYCSPFRTLFAWIFSSQGKSIIHSSAVGGENGGVLFVGPGGMGKSTSSLACIKKGLKFASDDSVLVDSNKKVYSLYCSSRLLHEDLKYFQELESRIAYRDNKTNFFLDKKEIINSFELRAIICPRVGAEKSEIVPIKALEALRVLAPSSMLHLPGQSSQMLSFLSDLVKKVPAYNLSVRSRDEVGDLVFSILKKS